MSFDDVPIKNMVIFRTKVWNLERVIILCSSHIKNHITKYGPPGFITPHRTVGWHSGQVIPLPQSLRTQMSGLGLSGLFDKGPRKPSGSEESLETSLGKITRGNRIG